LAQSGARFIPFEPDPAVFEFPFAAKVMAAAFLEAQAQGEAERLVYMDRDTIVLQEPAEFLIPAGQVLGYRPVHHRLIGSAWDQAVDPFWKLVYEVCNVPLDHLFPMVTHAGERIRPYFNAGVYSIRPERGLLAQWRDLFFNCYRLPQFNAYYEKDQLYAIFIHQAIFTGILLQNLKADEMLEFSPKINYPLHLQEDIPPDQRPALIDELVTVRYERIFDESGWARFAMSENLKNWLEAQPRLQQPA
jgi:hypothetical protein